MSAIEQASSLTAQRESALRRLSDSASVQGRSVEDAEAFIVAAFINLATSEMLERLAATPLTTAASVAKLDAFILGMLELSTKTVSGLSGAH